MGSKIPALVLSFLALTSCSESHPNTMPCWEDDFRCIEQACPDFTWTPFVVDRDENSDDLCAGKDDCYYYDILAPTGGCPNNCGCLCYRGRAYPAGSCNIMMCPDESHVCLVY